VEALIFSLTALDFLGFGLPPGSPSWGAMLKDGTANMQAPWIISSAFSAIAVLLVLITFVGEAVREAFDPKKFTTYQ
jgi:microcin C transport system permease protein